ncbi:asparaginase [uncultured Thomasclavelia sp.]|uniref:asparaginase n=1 Tax=uncultured Thomasclavelia sp. TaxID=3025759 RepID=UPI0025E76332|nr:asparaginase [uncultured Thomasclavelia sp.]
MKNIVIVATGGTIAGSGQVGKTANYHAGTIDITQIIDTIPLINEVANIEAIQLFNFDSNEMNEEHWVVLVNKINELARDDHVDGIVVTHGTDTLDETAYFLNLTVHTYKPVVLTGAMRPASATSADGPLNLYQAVCLAANDQALGHGVMAVFSSTIYSGRDIQKTNSFKTDAFDQKDFGCLGYMIDDQVMMFSRTFKKHTLQSMFSQISLNDLPKVGIAYYYAGASGEILKYLAETCKGIVIIGSGRGDYSDEWLQVIEELSDQGIIFVRSSRVHQGIVYEDEYFDPHQKCVPSNTLSGQKARVLLMLSLKVTNDLNEIKQIFNEY